MTSNGFPCSFMGYQRQTKQLKESCMEEYGAFMEEGIYSGALWWGRYTGPKALVVKGFENTHMTISVFLYLDSTSHFFFFYYKTCKGSKWIILSTAQSWLSFFSGPFIFDNDLSFAFGNNAIKQEAVTKIVPLRSFRSALFATNHGPTESLGNGRWSRNGKLILEGKRSHFRLVRVSKGWKWIGFAFTSHHRTKQKFKSYSEISKGWCFQSKQCIISQNKIQMAYFCFEFSREKLGGKIIENDLYSTL